MHNQAMWTLLCGQYGVGIFDGDSQDSIVVIIIDEEDVIVAYAGWGHKFAGQVYVGLSSGFHHGGITCMGILPKWWSWWESIILNWCHARF